MTGKRILAMLVSVGLCMVLLWNIVYAQAATGVTVSITSPDNGTSVAAGATITVTASAENCPDETGSNITYTWSGPGSFSPTTGASVQWTAPTSPGDATITVTATADGKSDTDFVTVKVVGVAKIQYKDPDSGFKDMSGTLFLMQGTTVTFRAVASPAGVAWPAGKPVWGGTSGASGTGETITVTFDELSSDAFDAKTITAECGNTVSIGATVYSLRGVHVAYDYFEGRATTTYGVREDVELFCVTNQVSILPNLVGGLEWSVHAGDKIGLVNQGDGVGKYTCHVKADNVTLRLTVQSGPSKGRYVDTGFDVIPPSGTRMTRKNTIIRHFQGVASAGMALQYYLEPKTVSFKNVKFREGYCEAYDTEGIYDVTPPLQHGTGSSRVIEGGNSTDGCRVDGCDHVIVGRSQWGNVRSQYKWLIPTVYVHDREPYEFEPKGHRLHWAFIHPNGDAEIAKGGYVVGATLNSPSVLSYGCGCPGHP